MSSINIVLSLVSLILYVTVVILNKKYLKTKIEYGLIRDKLDSALEKLASKQSLEDGKLTEETIMESVRYIG